MADAAQAAEPKQDDAVRRSSGDAGGRCQACCTARPPASQPASSQPVLCSSATAEAHACGAHMHTLFRAHPLPRRKQQQKRLPRAYRRSCQHTRCPSASTWCVGVLTTCGGSASASAALRGAAGAAAAQPRPAGMRSWHGAALCRHVLPINLSVHSRCACNAAHVRRSRRSCHC